MVDDNVKLIRERYLGVLDVISSAAARSGRSAREIRLVVVTKTHPIEVVQAVIEAGAECLGENYAEEGVTKIQSLAGRSAVEWHMIGHVQSRKAQLVASYFDFMHSLDGLKLANRLNRFCMEASRRLPVLLEFNVGGEESKGGWEASNEADWPRLAEEVAPVLQLPNLQVRGLMTMPPLGNRAEDSRVYFQRTKRLQDFLSGQFPQANFSEISMGTSTDFEVAVEEGATLVRVGTAITGPRQYKTETG